MSISRRRLVAATALLPYGPAFLGVASAQYYYP